MIFRDRRAGRVEHPETEGRYGHGGRLHVGHGPDEVPVCQGRLVPVQLNDSGKNKKKQIIAYFKQAFTEPDGKKELLSIEHAVIDLLIERVERVAGLLDDGDSQLLAHGYDVPVSDLTEGLWVLLEREVVRVPISGITRPTLVKPCGRDY